MTDYFPAAVKIVLEDEGTFADDANDPGGATYYGIARASHPEIAWPPTKDQAIALYRQEYWDQVRCGDMPWAWALAVFEGQVNQGDVIRPMQRCLSVTVDGKVGDATIHAASCASSYLLDKFFAARAIAYIADANFNTYRVGWFARLFKCRALCAVTPS